MLLRTWYRRRVAAITVIVALVVVTAAVPAWCVATGMWW
jgi:hypothetical protein